MSRRKLKKQMSHFWRNFLRPVLFVVIVLTAFRSSIADWNDVPTGSMKPTILEGDRIFVNKLAYDLKVPYTTWRVAQWSDPTRGEVVVFYSPKDGTRMVKRVVAGPGDVVELRDDRLLVNGKAMEYEPIPSSLPQLLATERLGDRPHPVMITPSLPAMRTFAPYTVPEGKFFLMGDNRDNSFDSRYFGPVDRDRILGRATNVVVSLDAQNYFLPRWNRFLKPVP